MHSALVARSIAELGAVRRHIRFSAKLRTLDLAAFSRDGQAAVLVDCFGDVADATSWKVIDHSAAITRAYALFEVFVLSILREFLGFLRSSYTFQGLGNDFSTKYKRGIGQILLDHEKARFAKIDIGDLLAQASAAVNGQNPYQLQTEALVQTEQNLRMPELQRLFAHCGLQGIGPWIQEHNAIRGFFQGQSRLSQTADSELKQLVEYRNEASHGEVDQVLGSETLVEVTDFFEAMIVAVADFVQYDILRRSKDIGIANIVGVISERFHDDIVVAKVENSTLKVGEQLYIFGKGMTGIARIGSIRLQDVAHESVTIGPSCEVGLTLGIRAKIGCELVRIS